MTSPSKSLKKGALVRVKVGKWPSRKGVVAGAKIEYANGVFYPVNVSDDPKVKDVRNYREAYISLR